MAAFFKGLYQGTPSGMPPRRVDGRLQALKCGCVPSLHHSPESRVRNRLVVVSHAGGAESLRADDSYQGMPSAMPNPHPTPATRARDHD
jgi:hypothetical protein